MAEPATDVRAWRGSVAAAVLAVLGLLLSGCGGSSNAASLHGQPVDPPFQVSGAELQTTDGTPFSLTTSTTKPLTLVFFGYTHCPDICPLVMADLASAMTRLSDADRKQVQVVFVTTDPSRDTDAVLRRWLDHIDPDFIGVTGAIDTIAAVGKSVGVGMGAPLGSGGYDVNTHSTQVTEIDARNQAPMYWHEDTTSAQFAADIHTILSDQ